jgi:protein-S-isoprenylcysteine O-methyltransferase Ste14
MVLGEYLLLLSGNVGQHYLATGSLSSQTLISIPLTLTAFACIVLVPRIEKEEKMLSEALGDEWKTYTSDVKWRLLPGIF